MNDDTIDIEDYKVASEFQNKVVFPSFLIQEKHISNKSFLNTTFQNFKDALGSFSKKNKFSTENDKFKGIDFNNYDPITTERIEQLELSPNQINLETEPGPLSTQLFEQKKTDDSQNDYPMRLRIRNEESSSQYIPSEGSQDFDHKRLGNGTIYYSPEHKKSNHWKKAKGALGALKFGKEYEIIWIIKSQG